MIRLAKSLSAWGTDDFNSILKSELEQLRAGELPLQEGLLYGSYGKDDKIGIMILGVAEEADTIQARVGIFYTSIIAGCNCADDPTPVDEQNEYCEALVVINKGDAVTTIHSGE